MTSVHRITNLTTYIPKHTHIYVQTHISEVAYFSNQASTAMEPNDWIRQMNGAVKYKLSSSVLKNTWWKTVSLSNELGEEEKNTDWLAKRGRHTEAGWGERLLFLLYDANCMQTPTYSAVSLTVKAPPDRQPGETHAVPSSSLPRNHKTWCLMAKIDSHFLLLSSGLWWKSPRTQLVEFKILF